MDYNELKRHILGALSAGGSMNSEAVAECLLQVGLRVEMHAIRMALMRYYRQGLLTRRRVEGLFLYSLSERGMRRLGWLESAKSREEPESVDQVPPGRSLGRTS